VEERVGRMRSKSLIVPVLLSCLASLAACGTIGPPQGVQLGMPRNLVLNELGGADEVSDFVMPEDGFFGPQEALSGLIEPGASVEQWVYYQDDEVTYAWFSGPPGSDRGGWTLVAWTTVPLDAVY